MESQRQLIVCFLYFLLRCCLLNTKNLQQVGCHFVSSLHYKLQSKPHHKAKQDKKGSELRQDKKQKCRERLTREQRTKGRNRAKKWKQTEVPKLHNSAMESPVYHMLEQEGQVQSTICTAPRQINTHCNLLKLLKYILSTVNYSTQNI
jgi:hypothetical protein